MVVLEVQVNRFREIEKHNRRAICLHGEMDITRVFGTRFSGSNPDGATIFLDWNFSRNSGFLFVKLLC